MNWLNQSFQQYTIAWVFLASAIGGITGAAIKFGFEDLLRPIVGSRRETRAITARYTPPLVRSAERLERGINNFVINIKRGKRWYSDSDYYRLSTLHKFAEYLAWIRIIEQNFGFLPFESFKEGRVFNQRMDATIGGLASFGYFSWLQDDGLKEQSRVNRDMLRAIGEAAQGDDGKPMDFTTFTVTYTTDSQFQVWFTELDELLKRAERAQPSSTPTAASLSLDRLIVTGGTLRALVQALDPKHHFAVGRVIVNIDKLSDRRVAENLHSKYPTLVKPAHFPADPIERPAMSISQGD